MHLDTNDTLHHDLNVPYVRNEIKRLRPKIADEMEEHLNNLAINLTPIKKKITDRTVIYKTYAINCQMYY